MKYRTSVVLGLALVLLAGCQGRERTRPGSARPGVDSAVADDAMVELDGSVSDDAMIEDAGVDAAFDTGMTDGETPDTSPPPRDSAMPDTSRPPEDTGPPTCAPTPGALGIVEVMIASQGGTDQGEWFEIVNTSACAIDLSGLEIGSPTSDGTPVTHTVSMGVVAPGAHFVFALSGDPTENHELPWDYVYGSGMRSDVFLGNAGDVLTIAYGGVELDRIEWMAEDFIRGAALQYPRGASISGNGDITRWCDAVRIYSTSGGTFYGTPGAPNDGCR